MTAEIILGQRGPYRILTVAIGITNKKRYDFYYQVRECGTYTVIEFDSFGKYMDIFGEYDTLESMKVSLAARAGVLHALGGTTKER